MDIESQIFVDGATLHLIQGGGCQNGDATLIETVRILSSSHSQVHGE